MLFSENMLVGTATTIYESNVSVACVLPVTAQRFGRCNGGKDINLRCDLEPQYSAKLYRASICMDMSAENILMYLEEIYVGVMHN